MAPDLLTLQQAVGDALGVTLTRHPALRNAVNTLSNAFDSAGLITWVNPPYGSASDKKRRLVRPNDRTCLINAVLIQGVFAEPKVVIKLFQDPAERSRHAEWARTLLIDRQSIAGQGFIPSTLLQFLDLLAADIDLKAVRLPNPFATTLPQMGLGPSNSTSLLRLLASQTAILSQGDSMMAHYLDGDLEKAHVAALEMTSDSPILKQWKALIVGEYEEARAVAQLLDDWRQ
ncbi:hypothetical protein NPS46_04820 [Pseudomonas putida]|uniref:hypothetical protein n=1 Tax=Pseudomonas putida TaxID=303 RepID=UPI00236457ED|nr:hypothetical protein [Pseudomonas putida]MDD2051873.1 hypothetical protein [Pseudomonas putida]